MYTTYKRIELLVMYHLQGIDPTIHLGNISQIKDDSDVLRLRVEVDENLYIVTRLKRGWRVQYGPITAEDRDLCEAEREAVCLCGTRNKDPKFELLGWSNGHDVQCH